MVFLRYVEHTGARSAAVVGARVPQAMTATLVAASASAAVVVYRFAGVERIAVMGAVLALTAALAGKYFAVRVGGFTGDLLGATEQIGELAGLSVLAWGAR
jgi:adenosylcobinamide-GDP ribazoletransferase